jgi:hypothetical protein
MVACIDFFEMSEICRPKFIVRHSTCVAASCGSSQPAAPQKPRQPKRPFEAIACDLMGPYPRTPSGNKFILVVTDLFSRWVDEHDVCDCAPTGRRGLHQAGLPWSHHHRQRLPIHVPALDEGLSTLANTNVDNGPIYAPGEPYGAPQPGAKENSPISLSWTGTEHVGQRTLHGSVQCAPPSQRRYGHVP